MQTNRFRGNIFKSVLAFAAIVSVTGMAMAAPTSCNLPAPNYVNGATLQYNSGYKINNNAGNLNASIQTGAANAANASSKLNIDLGNKANNVANLGYNSFNIGQGKTVNFNFGGTGQAALNRVTQVGNQYASKIIGSITQSGKGGAVFLINPNGILFGANSKINVNSLTVSTLDLSSDYTLNSFSFSRGTNSPKGILIKRGAQINTSKGVNFVSNGILDRGANISSKGNIQLITGDGVTLNYSSNYTPQLVDQNDITASTALPSQIRYANGEVDKNSAVNIGAGIIKGNNVEIVSKINNALIDTSLSSMVNIDGVVTVNSVSGCKNGNMIVFADNTAFAEHNNPVGIKINRDLNVTGNVELSAEQLSARNITSGGTTNIATQFTTGNPIKSRIGNIRAGKDVYLSNFYNTELITGNIKALGDVSLLANESIIRTGNILSEQNISLGAGTAEIFTGNINASKNVSISSGRELGVTTKNISAGHDIDVVLYQSSLTTGNLNAKGSFIGSVRGDSEDCEIISGNINVGKDFILGENSGFAGDGTLTSGSITAGKGIKINLSGFTKFPGDKIISTDDLKANADIVLSAPFLITTGNIKTNGSLTAGYILPDETLTNAQSITMKNIQAGKNVTLSAETINTGNICSSGSTTVYIQGNEATSNIGSINSKDGINLNVFNNSLTIKGVNSDGGINLNAYDGGEIHTDNIISNQGIGFNAADGGLISAGNLQAKKNISFYGFRTTFTTNNISSGQDIIFELHESRANTGNITANGNLLYDFYSSSGDSSMLNTGNIVVGGSFTPNSTEDNFAFINSGSIKAGKSISIYLAKPIYSSINTGNLTANSDIVLSTPTMINTGNINSGGSLTAGYILPDETLTKAESIIMKNIKVGNNVDVAAHTVQTGTIQAGGTINIDRD